jgi:hypothetical protein
LNENLGLQAKYKQINKKIFKYLLNMFCYVKQVYEYCVCESTFIRGHQISWFQQNTLIHMLHSSSQTLEVASKRKTHLVYV